MCEWALWLHTVGYSPDAVVARALRDQSCVGRVALVSLDQSLKAYHYLMERLIKKTAVAPPQKSIAIAVDLRQISPFGLLSLHRVVPRSYISLCPVTCATATIIHTNPVPRALTVYSTTPQKRTMTKYTMTSQKTQHTAHTNHTTSTMARRVRSH